MNQLVAILLGYPSPFFFPLSDMNIDKMIRAQRQFCAEQDITLI